MFRFEIIYVDECGFVLDDPTIHGYAQRGKSAYVHSRVRANAIAAILDSKFQRAKVLLKMLTILCSLTNEIMYKREDSNRHPDKNH